jgi:choline dehydrogenase
MGKDPMAVVDPDSMKVHGLENLRIVDASVMPYVTNGNIYSPVMMIAEKAADMILGNTLLSPSSTSWYRHQPGSDPKA